MSRDPRSYLLVPAEADTPEKIRDQVNRILKKLQDGSLQLGGLRLAVDRTVVPTDAPGSGEPNLVAVNVAGTLTLYWWDLATGWIVVGTQT